MKNMNWKQWVTLAVLIAFIITEIVFVFIKPLVALCGVAGFIIGALLTYGWINKKKGEN
ncbi:MAG: hypothetical protein [Wendovervirus sonii]|uniref:Uncharacterized protein n=1 Tax=phage Lak_Megaphage_Sonny TaxID=3109229 RepID=A0ABZ0Z4W7_9CAUD|nr:MAG: hypothetical protein [phage Lak_Megaphage_Sonny]